MHHTGPVNAVAVTPDGTQFVSAGDDSVIRIWDRATEQLVHELIGHTTKVMAVAVTPDGRQVISASTGGTVRRWNRSAGDQIGEPLGGYPGRIRAMVLTPDAEQIITGYDTGELTMWNRFSGKQIGGSLDFHTDAINALAVHTDGTVISAGEDGKIWTMPFGTWERLRKPFDINKAVLSIAIPPDGGRLIVAPADGTIRMVERESGLAIGEPLTGHTLWVESVAVTPDARRIVSAGRDGTIRIWDMLTGRQIGEPLRGHTGAVRTVAVTPDGRQIISGGEDGTVRTWDVLDGRAGILVNGLAPVRTMAVSPDGTYVVSAGSPDNKVLVWDRVSGRSVTGPLAGHASPVIAVAITPDSKQIITGGLDGAIWIWDRATGQAIRAPLVEHPGGLNTVAVTLDGRYIVSAGGDRTIRVWERATARLVNEILTGEAGEIHHMTVAPDGVWIISAGRDGSVRSWDRATGAHVGPMTGHQGAVHHVAVTPDGTQIISGGVDGTVRVWDRVTGQQVGEPLIGHADTVNAVTITPDGSLIVSAGEDGTIRVWDRASGQQVGEPLTGHESWVGSVGVTPDGAQIISAGGDGTIRVWDVPGQRERVSRARLAEVVSDLESSVDLLGITEDVHTIAAVVAALSTVPPLSIALLGDWGAGKSSFMRQVQDRVEELARRSRVGDASAFAANVRQVRFNAWHYSDDHLWVGLVEHLFAELARAEEGPSESINELEVELSAKEGERERLEADLKAVNARRGWLGALFLPLRSARVARAVVGGIWRELRAHGWRVVVLLAVLGVGVAGIVVGDGVLRWVAGVVAGLTVVLGPAVAAWRRLGEYTERARKELLTRKSEVDNDIAEARRKLEALDPKRRLDKLLAEISKPERYASYRGLTGLIHRDLRQLSEDLAAVRARWEAAGAVGAAPLQRIVLYVDDLDRCTPQRVVSVLQAVNLLLSMELFVVVVAVDPGWLLRSLKRHHEGLFDDNEVAYLDKIFHIPVALRPMGGRAEAYLRSLLPAEEVTAEQVTRRETVEIPRQRGPVAQQAVSADDQPRPATQAAPAKRAVVGSPGPNLNPEGLRLRAVEREFLARLTPLLATPRAVKKLVNLYRLLRLGVPEGQLNAFVGGPFQAAALLLAALVGTPHEARDLLKKLRTAPDGDILDVAGGSALGDLITSIRTDTEVHGDVATYRRWAATVARYGFETYELFEG